MSELIIMIFLLVFVLCCAAVDGLYKIICRSHPEFEGFLEKILHVD